MQRRMLATKEQELLDQMDEDQADEWVRLRETLLRIGGDVVVPPDHPEGHFGALLEAGITLVKPRIRFVGGKPSGCYGNAGRTWATDPERFTYMTGYYLTDDGLWREHAWVYDEETNEVLDAFDSGQLAYAGLMLKDEGARFFHGDEYKYYTEEGELDLSGVPVTTDIAEMELRWHAASCGLEDPAIAHEMMLAPGYREYIEAIRSGMLEQLGDYVTAYAVLRKGAVDQWRSGAETGSALIPVLLDPRYVLDWGLRYVNTAGGEDADIESVRLTIAPSDVVMRGYGLESQLVIDVEGVDPSAIERWEPKFIREEEGGEEQREEGEDESEEDLELEPLENGEENEQEGEDGEEDYEGEDEGDEEDDEDEEESEED